MQLNKTFLRASWIGAVVIALAIYPVIAWSAVPSASPDHITLTWSGDPHTTQTITWRTDVATNDGWVEFFEASFNRPFDALSRKAPATLLFFTTNSIDMNLHSAILSGLKPGTSYIYRVGDGKSWSERYSFRTEPTKPLPFKILVFGDSQSTVTPNLGYGVWRKTLVAAYGENPDAAFFVNVGDLVDVGQDYAHWEQWFEAADGIISSLNAMPVIGNHETYSPSGKFSMPLYFTSQFNLPQNGPERLRGQVYSFDYGNAHIVVLDSQAGEEGRFVPGMLEEQVQWLDEDLRSTSKRWKLVFFHRPPFSNRPGGDNANIRNALTPILDKHHVDFVFNGHDHGYARTYPLFNDNRVEDSDRGTVYVTVGRSGTKTYSGLISRSTDALFHDTREETNYVVIEVSSETLTLKAYSLSGALIDSYAAKKFTSIN